jgi:hypothetical protein
MGNSSSSPVGGFPSLIAEGQKREAEGQRREAEGQRREAAGKLREAHYLSVIADGQRREAEERTERATRAAELARAHEAARAAQIAQWAQHQAALVEKIAGLSHELDIWRGAVRARALLEACLSHIGWARRKLSAATAASVPTPLSAAASTLLDGSTYPALVAYLGASALANGADATQVLARARKLCGALCGPITADGTPAELFAAPVRDRETLIAFAVLVRFAGRDPGLYTKDGARTRLVLRVPPSGLHATPAELAAAPLLATEISVELLVERGAGEGGAEGESSDDGGGGGGGSGSAGAQGPSTPPAAV